MNMSRFTKKQFSFLRQYGFNKKYYSKNTDFEIHYERKDTIIELRYYLCVNTEMCLEGKISTEELLARSFFYFDVVIQHNKKRGSIFLINLFDKDDIENLEKRVNQLSKDNLREVIILYANFLKNNINKIVT